MSNSPFAIPETHSARKVEPRPRERSLVQEVETAVEPHPGRALSVATIVSGLVAVLGFPLAVLAFESRTVVAAVIVVAGLAMVLGLWALMAGVYSLLPTKWVGLAALVLVPMSAGVTLLLYWFPSFVDRSGP